MGVLNAESLPPYKLETMQFNGSAIYGSIWSGQGGKTDVQAGFYWNDENKESKKPHKDEPACYFSCPFKLGPLLIWVPLWWSIDCRRSDGYTCWRPWEGCILHCECPLMAGGFFILSVWRGSGSGGRRRNNGRKDSNNYREEQRVMMKNGMEGRFILLAWAGMVRACCTAGETGGSGTGIAGKASVKSTWIWCCWYNWCLVFN